MRDFTYHIYKQLLDVLIDQGYQFQTFSDFMKDPADKAVVLRHDIDARKHHALKFARIQARAGVQGSYYFRMVPQSFDEDIIQEIASMGHEIGYHYEELKHTRGDLEEAFELAKRNISKFRKITGIETICMHGSPFSRFDNRDLWKHYDYRDLGIIGEPYFDVDYDQVLYLTDTGRRWDGERFSVRDKVKSNFDYSFRTTEDIIKALSEGQLPRQIMFNFHPQRWSDDKVFWTYELVLQNLKNVVKRMLTRIKSK